MGSVRSWCDGSSDRSSMGGERCSSVVRAFSCGAMGRRIDPPWGGPIELFLVLASASRDVALRYERLLMVRWVVRSILHRVDGDVAPW